MDIMKSKDLITKKKGVNKYRAKKITIDGIKFDSMKEAERYGVLKLLKLGGEIKDFELQKTYELKVNEQLICKYIADFVVYNNNGSVEVEDVKSVITAQLPAFRIKAKLMKAIHGIEIKIIK